jgi:hypothetical protein
MQDNPSTPIGASIKEICRRHSVSRSTLYADLGAGNVIARKKGKRTIVDVASADAHYTSLPPAKIKPPSSDRKQPSANPAAKAKRGKRGSTPPGA